MDFTTLQSTFITLCNGIGKALLTHGTSIGQTLATFALTLRVIIAGFAVMFGQGARTLSDHLFDIVLKSALIAFLVYAQIPQGWLTTAMQNMPTAGQAIANGEILSLAGDGASGDPPTYWSKYIFGSGAASDNKFSADWIMTNIYGWNSAVTSFVTIVVSLCGGVVASFAASLIPTLTIGESTTLVFFGLAIAGILTLIILGASAFIACTGLTIFGIFAFVGSFVGPYLVFNVVLGLGVAVLPLMYFKRFEMIWVPYLVFLTGSVLCVFLYYICAAIGYDIATKAVTLLFTPSGVVTQFMTAHVQDIVGLIPGATTTATVSQTIFDTLLPVGSLSRLPGIGDLVTKFMSALAQGLMMPAAWAAGIGIMSAVISGGMAMSGMAVGLAFKWAEAFTSESALGAVQDAFQKMGTATHSGMSSMLNSAVQTVGGAASNVTVTLGSIAMATGKKLGGGGGSTPPRP